MTARSVERHGILFAALLVAAGLSGFPSTADAQDFPPPRQTCTATNVGGSAYDGFVCGGSVMGDCSPGAIYQCQGGGVQDPVNNCVLAQSCASGCLTGPNSTPPTVNTDFPVANDACFAGERPLIVSPVDPVGGTDVTVTATLSEPQNTANGPILNMNGGGVLIPHPFCAVPFRLAPGPSNGPSSATFGLPTAVVNTETAVHLHAGISYTDTNGRGRFLVSVPFAVRLQPGGTEPHAPAVKAVTAGPAVIGPGDMAVGDVELVKFAPARGIRATLTSSHPDVAAIVENNQPSVPPACTTSTGVANIQAASFVANDTTVTISATSGAPGETPATTTLIVRATPLRVARVTMSPNQVLAGSSSTGTVTLSRPAPAGGAQVFLASSEMVVTVPTSVTVPANQTSAIFTATTRADATAFVSSTIRAAVDPNNVDASAQLTVWPAGTAQGVAGLSLNPNSVVGPAPSTGTVTLKYAPPSEPVTIALSSSDTGVARVPSTITVSAGATQATFTVSTSEVIGSTASTISAGLEGSVQSANLIVKPANPPPPSAVLTAFSVNPTRVTAGQSALGTLTLQSAQSTDVPVDLSSQVPTSASVPASVIVPAGATSATFTITTNPNSWTVSVSLSASLNGTTLFSGITVEQAPSETSLSAVSLNPTTVVGGSSSTGTVSLTAPAPSGGTVVALSDNSSTAVTPSSVTVPAGATTTSFTVTTTSVSSNQTATVTASLGIAARSATLTITPSGGGGGGGTLQGFLSPAGNAPDSGGDGNGFQSSATSAYADDAAVASDTNSGTSTSTSCTNSGKDRHRFYDFGISVAPGSAVAGIEVRLDARADSTSGTPRMCVQLSWDGGSNWTAAKSTGTLGTGLTTFTLGGAADTWGRTWSPADLGNASFRVRVINVASSTSRDFFLEWIAVRAHVTTSGVAALNAVSVGPATVTGGTSATGTVTLTAGAPSGGAVVSLTSSNSAVASTPSSVTVAAGATSATFPVTTTAVTSNTSVTLTAAYNGTSRSATLTVTPPPPPASLSSLALNPTSVTGGSNSLGTVTLSSAAPSGGLTVTLSSSNTVAGVPANVTVAQGATSATFTIVTSAVSSSTPATITASDGQVSRTATLTVDPAATAATLTVTATGRSGERVTSSPAGINVSVGSTGSASFAAGTSITLSVSNGRDAVWSGACSSGGEKTRTCTFTLNANASVSANVQ